MWARAKDRGGEPSSSPVPEITLADLMEVDHVLACINPSDQSLIVVEGAMLESAKTWPSRGGRIGEGIVQPLTGAPEGHPWANSGSEAVRLSEESTTKPSPVEAGGSLPFCSKEWDGLSARIFLILVFLKKKKKKLFRFWS